MKNSQQQLKDISGVSWQDVTGDFIHKLHPTQRETNKSGGVLTLLYSSSEAMTTDSRAFRERDQVWGRKGATFTRLRQLSVQTHQTRRSPECPSDGATHFVQADTRDTRRTSGLTVNPLEDAAWGLSPKSAGCGWLTQRWHFAPATHTHNKQPGSNTFPMSDKEATAGCTVEFFF